MYIERITLKEGIKESKLSELIQLAEKCFDNRIRKISNSGKNNLLVFQGNSDEELCAIGLGAITLYYNKSFLKYIKTWTFEDTDEPDDYTDDVIAEFDEVEELCQKNK